MSDKHTSPGPMNQAIGRLESALKARDEAAAGVKAELHAVAGADCSRAALDLYRREYSEANDTFCDLLIINAPIIIRSLRDYVATEKSHDH